MAKLAKDHPKLLQMILKQTGGEKKKPRAKADPKEKPVPKARAKPAPKPRAEPKAKTPQQKVDALRAQLAKAVEVERKATESRMALENELMVAEQSVAYATQMAKDTEIAQLQARLVELQGGAVGYQTPYQPPPHGYQTPYPPQIPQNVGW